MSVFLVTAWLQDSVDHGPRKPRQAPGRTDGTVCSGGRRRTSYSQSSVGPGRTRAASVVPGRQSTFSRSRLWTPRSARSMTGRTGSARSLTGENNKTPKLVVDSIAFYSAWVRRPAIGISISSITQRSQQFHDVNLTARALSELLFAIVF